MKTKRFISLILSIVTLMSFLCVGTISASAASNFSSSNTAPSSSDYAYWNGSKMVKSSTMTTSKIKYVQQFLNWCIDNEKISSANLKTYGASKLTIDGSFGPACKKATKAFQKQYGLSVDGSFGPGTIAKMKSLISSSATSSANKSTATSTAKYNLTWPIPSSVSGYKRITSSLGNRTAPVPGASIRHKGIDIGIPNGSPVLATYDGIVTFASKNSDRGNYVVIYHSSIGLTSVYQHLSSYSVKVGQTVTKGQQIAKSGNTGKSSGPHLHFELVLTSSKPKSVDCAWTSGVKLLDGHYNNTLIKYTYK